MKWQLASAASAVAIIGTTLALTLPSSGHTPVAAARTVTTAAPVTAADDVGRFHPHLVLVAPVVSWTVRKGDTLSLIAKDRYGVEKAWPLIYWANRKQVKWANQIQIGQTLDLPIPDGPIPAAPKLLEPPPPPRPHVTVAVSYSSSGSRTYHSTYTAASGSYHGSGSMESCIISRESGGNSQVMNSSGHYGLYQFSSSTWAGSGGNPADFGHASVAEQRQVFSNAVAARGYSDWTPYDGC